jgi:actin-related protein 4
MILKKGITRSPLAGNFVSSQTRLLFSASTPPITVIPHYLINSKIAVDANQPPQASLKTWPPGTEPRSSYRAYQEERVLHEFKESVVSVWPGPTKLSSLTPDDIATKIAPRPFELPDGYNQLFSSERPKPVEALFDAKSVLLDPYKPPPPVTQTIPDLIRQSISAVDVDIRPLLLSHVIVVGGGSLVHGFTDRLNNELQIMFPSLRSRVQASGMTVERRFASWIGGSILASLGTFHQMWISRKEYDEHGAGIVEKRCK